jgi:hypothetical protein
MLIEDPGVTVAHGLSTPEHDLEWWQRQFLGLEPAECERDVFGLRPGCTDEREHRLIHRLGPRGRGDGPRPRGSSALARSIDSPSSCCFGDLATVLGPREEENEDARGGRTG